MRRRRHACRHIDFRAAEHGTQTNANHHMQRLVLLIYPPCEAVPNPREKLDPLNCISRKVELHAEQKQATHISLAPDH